MSSNLDNETRTLYNGPMRIAGQQQTWSRREQAVFAGGLAVYGIALAIGRASVDDGDPDWRRWVVVAVAIAAALRVVVRRVLGGAAHQGGRSPCGVGVDLAGLRSDDAGRAHLRPARKHR